MKVWLPKSLVHDKLITFWVQMHVIPLVVKLFVMMQGMVCMVCLSHALLPHVTPTCVLTYTCVGWWRRRTVPSRYLCLLRHQSFFLHITKVHSKYDSRVWYQTIQLCAKQLVLEITDIPKRSSFDIFWGTVFIMIMIMNILAMIMIIMKKLCDKNKSNCWVTILICVSA